MNDIRSNKETYFTKTKKKKEREERRRGYARQHRAPPAALVRKRALVTNVSETYLRIMGWMGSVNCLYRTSGATMYYGHVFPSGTQPQPTCFRAS